MDVGRIHGSHAQSNYFHLAREKLISSDTFVLNEEPTHKGKSSDVYHYKGEPEFCICPISPQIKRTP